MGNGTIPPLMIDLLPFIYAIGRVQGIREERARRRKEV